MEETQELDASISYFFKKMLLDTHTVAKAKKVFRKEARKIFIREICKNLTEMEYCGSGFNSKLLQNYCAMVIIYQFLMVPEKKIEHGIKDQRVKAIQ